MSTHIAAIYSSALGVARTFDPLTKPMEITIFLDQTNATGQPLAWIQFYFLQPTVRETFYLSGHGPADYWVGELKWTRGHYPTDPEDSTISVLPWDTCPLEQSVLAATSLLKVDPGEAKVSTAARRLSLAKASSTQATWNVDGINLRGCGDQLERLLPVSLIPRVR